VAASKRKKTGMGQDPLSWIQDTTKGGESIRVVTLPIEQVVESEKLKLRLDLPEVETLAEDIKSRGQTTPAFVRPLSDDSYELISGYRRLAAIRSVGGETIWVRVFSDLSDEDAERLAISENLQRKDLSDLEQARIYLRLQERGLEVKEIGRLIGKKERTVHIYLAVAKAPDSIGEALHQGKISLYVAHELVQACKNESSAYVCSQPENLAQAIEHIAEQKLPVRQVKEYLENLAVKDEDDTKRDAEQPSPSKKRERGPFQPIKFSENKRGFDLVVKFRRKEDAESIIKTLKETLARMKREMAKGEGGAG
jgi:ParB family chromosome partitioning protein